MNEQFTEADKPRLEKQLNIVRDVMLSAAICGSWLTLVELERMTKYPQASISADLRHLRKAKNGGYTVEKRRRGDRGGTWEYRVSRKGETDGVRTGGNCQTGSNEQFSGGIRGRHPESSATVR